MTLSKAQIFNITLNILGVSTPLERADSNDSRAILLNNHYELARDYVLRDFDWNFASAYVEPSLKKINQDFSEYKYTFDYPNDCIFIRAMFEKGNYVLNKFSISSDENCQKVILCNIKNPVIRYTKKIDKELSFSPEYTIALAHYLASLTANVITGSIQKGENAYRMYVSLLRRAKVINAQEDTDYIYQDDTYLNARD